MTYEDVNRKPGTINGFIWILIVANLTADCLKWTVKENSIPFSDNRSLVLLLLREEFVCYSLNGSCKGLTASSKNLLSFLAIKIVLIQKLNYCAVA